ncbi:hypothetical protein LZ30DRAFT_735735 [Colletotrichum cereale]|nr:hypothetical protein LZ30DRAFT_735735 [Colletotrichum cereale]
MAPTLNEDEQSKVTGVLHHGTSTPRGPEGLSRIVNATTFRPVESGKVIAITADSMQHLPNNDIPR